MTEHQIETLRNLLAGSNAVSNSEELDNKILEHARASVAAKPRREGWLSGIGFLTPAMLAIVLTLGLFFWMGQLVSVDQVQVAKQSPIEALEFDHVNDSGVNTLEEHISSIDRPERVAVLPRPEQTQAANNILFEYELPTTEALLANMILAPDLDSNEVEHSITLALSDIQIMIHQRQFDDARIRYAMLKQSCQGCRLPNTLEALVMADSSFTKPG